MTTKANCPKLSALADACLNGACNICGLVKSFGEAVAEIPPHECGAHPAIKIILGQLSFLAGESLGPTPEAMTAFAQWQ